MSIRNFAAADIPFGLALSGQAGWNQTEADWRRALTLGGNGCFVAEHRGQPAGTTMTCRFGPAAWIAMVLVDERFRQRGIGTALMRHALDFLDRAGVRSVWLDATPLGRPLYEKLGFVAEGTLHRYAGIPRELTAGGDVEAISARDADSILALDRAAYGYERTPLLASLRDSPVHAAVRAEGRLSGFFLSRPGRNAFHLGPCVADYDAGPRLLSHGLTQLVGQPVYADVPEANEAARKVVQNAGLTVQRPLYRMRRGAAITWAPQDIWASFGPEKG